MSDGGGGSDVFNTANGSDVVTITSSAEADTVNMGTGADDLLNLSYANGTGAAVMSTSTLGGDGFFGTVTVGGATRLTYSGVERFNVVGSLLADLLAGGSGADVLSGGIGADTLFGGGGDDILFGEAGADTLRGGAATTRSTPATTRTRFWARTGMIRSPAA